MVNSQSLVGTCPFEEQKPQCRPCIYPLGDEMNGPRLLILDFFLKHYDEMDVGAGVGKGINILGCDGQSTATVSHLVAWC